MNPDVVYQFYPQLSGLLILKIYGKQIQKNLIQISTTPTFDAQISCCLINARSVCNKNDIILDYIISNDIDLAVITETWLGEGANFDNVIGSLSPPGYILVHSPRHGKRGGGIAFLHKIGLALTTRKCTKYATFECFEAVITNKTSSICLVAVYCPGKHTCSVKNYMADFSTLLEHHSTSSAKTVMLGDFNIHVDCLEKNRCCSVYWFTPVSWSSATCTLANSHEWTHIRSCNLR